MCYAFFPGGPCAIKASFIPSLFYRASSNVSGIGLCGRWLSEFIDRRYSQSCWYFRPSFFQLLPLYPPLWFTSTPPSTPSLCQSTVYTDRLWLVKGGGGGDVGLCCVGDHILQEPDPELAGLRQIKVCRKVPLQVNIFR